MKRLLKSILTAACLTLLSAQAVRAQSGSTEAARLEVMPPNLSVREDLRARLKKIWLRSPAFRRQCERIGGTPNLAVTLKVGARPRDFNSYHAITWISKFDHGRMEATVMIVDPLRLVEMIGHEFEHIIEQIEGYNLRAAAEQKNYAAIRTERGYYETQRAISAGRQIYEEYRSGKSNLALLK